MMVGRTFRRVRAEWKCVLTGAAKNTDFGPEGAAVGLSNRAIRMIKQGSSRLSFTA